MPPVKKFREAFPLCSRGFHFVNPLKQGNWQSSFAAISSSFETGDMEGTNIAVVCGVSIIVGTMLSVGEGTSVKIGALLF
jgi:hypothetical protein